MQIIRLLPGNMSYITQIMNYLSALKELDHVLFEVPEPQRNQMYDSGSSTAINRPLLLHALPTTYA